MVFVTVWYTPSNAKGLAIREEHDIVYRAHAETASVAAPAPGAPADAAWELHIQPDSVRRFRHSAPTFNSRRIHHDRDYTTATVGYPGLVASDNAGRELSGPDRTQQTPATRP
jgi:3-methylfumaryl-CoA hydratase